MTGTPYRIFDASARATVQSLCTSMRHAALAVFDHDQGFPHISRIALQAADDGGAVALLSALARHTALLRRNPRAALMIEAKDDTPGNMMARPRLSLSVVATQLPTTEARLACWIERDPKSSAYARLPDFSFWRFAPQSGILIAGFGMAYRFDAAEIE
ncbi:pyridoxamine 5-phosphate oxidase [Paracoccus aurantiacus]|uniref:Pyridoxamine 5-phosphate oxidase n=1 Tax=Paracoccus aurantiacus TaxID=2599412 RepID=A0A5C6S7R7_9RHOB|nr:pyridoxamine 5'-phosphate oxidase family protein [Paracoccus aurantiacus]TXB70561.1 pyridoxamine 5-phosphate oxidase [Paracoccus aurantiacus]